MRWETRRVPHRVPHRACGRRLARSVHRAVGPIRAEVSPVCCHKRAVRDAIKSEQQDEATYRALSSVYGESALMDHAALSALFARLSVRKRTNADRMLHVERGRDSGKTGSVTQALPDVRWSCGRKGVYGPVVEAFEAAFEMEHASLGRLVALHKSACTHGDLEFAQLLEVELLHPQLVAVHEMMDRVTAFRRV